MDDGLRADAAAWDVERTRFAAEETAEREAGRLGYPTQGQAPPAGPALPLLTAVFTDITRVILEGEQGVAGALSRIVDAGVNVVPGADVVSVTLRRIRGNGYSTPAHSDPLALRLDEVQYEHGEGPCVTAVELGGMGSAGSDDLAADPTWTRFGPAAAALGARSVYAVGLFPVGAERPLRGALNLYSSAVGGFSRSDREVALLLAAHASTALAHVTLTEAAELQEQQLQTVLESRDVIGQAKGILMERRGCSAQEAFDVLRRASQDLNIKLRDVAATLVARRGEL